MAYRVVKLALNPKKYIPLAAKVAQQQMCSLFQHAPFFMQGQMDIHPRSRWHRSEFRLSTGGYYPKDDDQGREICDLEPWDNTRRDMLILLLRTIVEKGIEGDLVELGVYKGHTAKLIHHYMPDRRLYLFDTFEGFTDRSVVAEKKNTNFAISASHFADSSLERAKAYISQKNDNVKYYKGYFPDSIPEGFGDRRFAFVHLDADLYEPTLAGLDYLYPRMSPRGMIVVHDYNAWVGARKAVDEFFADKPELPVPMPDKSGSVLIVRQGA